MIFIQNKQRTWPIESKRIESELKFILKKLGYDDFDISVLLTNNRTIHTYNKEYRSVDKPTDILSFQYHQLTAGQRIQPQTEDDKNLGDLIISVEYVKKQADELGITLQDRITRLLVHGVCHLLGYDHIEDHDWRRMRAKEGWLLKELRIEFGSNPK